ncbi:MAG: DUF1566 domain-containing protein [Polyangiaceae bacterium]
MALSSHSVSIQLLVILGLAACTGSEDPADIGLGGASGGASGASAGNSDTASGAGRSTGSVITGGANGSGRSSTIGGASSGGPGGASGSPLTQGTSAPSGGTANGSGGAFGSGGAGGTGSPSGSSSLGGNTGNGGSVGAAGSASGCQEATCGSHKWPCWKMPTPSSLKLPNPQSYTDLGNGAVRDNVTCLVWEKANPSTAGTLQASIDRCASLATNKYAGFSDWRLPTRVGNGLDRGRDAGE